MAQQKPNKRVVPKRSDWVVKNSSTMVVGKTAKSDRAAEDEKLQARVDRLPAHLREAARRSWAAREEDYRYLAEH